MAADDHEIGGLQLLPEELHRHRAAGVEDLGVLVDGDEAVGAAERGHGARTLAHRIGAVAIRAPAPGRPADIRCARARSSRASAASPAPLARRSTRQAGIRADHRRDEFVEREDRGRRKSGQDDDGLAVGDREADRLAGLQRDAVGDDTRVAQRVHDAVREIARRPWTCRRRRPRHRIRRPRASAAASACSSSAMTPRCTAMPPSSSTAAPMIAALES